MNGEQLYARYCAALMWHWPTTEQKLRAHAPTTPPIPKPWAFLSKIEKDAWWSLAEDLEL